MIEFRNVQKTFGRTQALRRLDLRLQPRRTTVFIGPSGCGKSTLLRLMIGLTQPDAGEVRFEGALMNSDNAQTLRRRMGYVIQDGGLFPHLTARQNVTLMARFLNREARQIEERLSALADLTKFPRAGLERYPGQLSGGQKQRVSLMRALMLDPDLLLLDEPLASLDPMIRSALQDDLKEIFHSLQKTVALVTHDMNEAAFFGDEIVLMREGSIVQQGEMRDLWDNPSDVFVTCFINAQRSILHEFNSQAACEPAGVR